MDSIESQYLPFSVNDSESQAAVYIFTPVAATTKLSFLLLALTVGIIAFVGNSLILSFIRKKQQTNHLIERSPFMKNLNLHIKSLAFSDVLCSAVSLPLYCVQMYADIFERGWACRINRYFLFAFPVITAHNLILISVERHYSLQQVPRTFRTSTVRKLTFVAWFLGFVTILLPISTFRGIRFDLNNTHYTVTCRYDRQHSPFRLMFLSFTVVEYVFPSFFLVAINISLCRKLHALRSFRSKVSLRTNNPLNANLRAAKSKGTFIIILIIFTFITPHTFYHGYVAYRMLTKSQTDFYTDYIIRCASGAMVFSNSAINFTIYVVQMKDFRKFLRRLFRKRQKDNALPSKHWNA